jgi:hypothetical protein
MMQEMLFQNMAPWCAEYFKLKKLGKSQKQKVHSLIFSHLSSLKWAIKEISDLFPPESKP